MSYLLPLLLIAGLLGNGLRLRARARRLPVLPPADGPVLERHVFITAHGVELDERVKTAASAYAADRALAVLDLVPRRLVVGRALDFVRSLDPAKYRADRLAPGRGAFHALLADAEVLERAAVTERTGLDPVRMAEVTILLKRYACTTTDAAIAPGLTSLPEALTSRYARLVAVYSAGARIALALPVVVVALLVAAALTAPIGLAIGAAALWIVQPYLIFGFGPLRPAGLHLAALARPVTEVVRWAGTVFGRWRPAPKPDQVAERVPAYTAELACGTERFFEDRRPDCPWCGSPELRVRLSTGDLIQRKPGRFTLEECRGCGHVFQNPRLSIDGLNFYYRDFYDGLGEAQTEFLFGTSGQAYAGRAEMVRPHTTPKRWLDVGGGHGHFCNLAKDHWPDTTFDALDMSESIAEAERRRWITTAHLGMFPDLADDLAGQYDVVSMHHYLEHTREPFAELEAAHRVLPEGGHLLIELPNPQSRFGKVLGRFWVPWFQPQHQHLISADNLIAALTERGFEPVAVERGPAHQPADLTGALALLISAVAPNPRQPWLRTPAPRVRVLASTALMTLALPLFLLTLAGDQLVKVAVRGGKGGNAFRVLAVRR